MSRYRAPLSRSTITVGSGLLVLLLSASIALGFRQPQPRSLTSGVLAPAGFTATVVPQEISEVRNEAPKELLAAVDAYRGAFGSTWRFHVDRRSGGIALAEGPGAPWAPGRGNALDPSLAQGSGPGGQVTLADLAAKARDLMGRYPDLFRVPLSQLELDERASVNLGETGQFWHVAFRQVVDGVPVAGARVVFRVSHGNLVQFGVDRTIPFKASQRTPSGLVTPAAARAAVALHLGAAAASLSFMKEEGALAWYPRGVKEDGAYTGAIGEGWNPVLAYRFDLKVAGESGSWSALVDARSGDVVRFVEATTYAALVKSGVYTKTNCSDPLNCVPGNIPEVAVTLPGANLNFVGAVCPVSGCFSNSAGAFDYPPGAVAASTSLDGKYFRIEDNCGTISAAAAAPSNIDLGTSDPNPPLNTNTDCQSATRMSPPNTGPTSGGSGDTHAARNCFYHLNLINQKARVYLPNNDWLKGKDGTQGAVNTLTNVTPACNAFWEPNGGELVFMKVTPGLNCNNTGEIPDIFLHEFGHGLDSNDASLAAPDGGTGEAMGDTFALLQGQDSCIGDGALLPDGTAWGNRAGYGTGSALCSGFRDLDYTRFCYHGTAAGCLGNTSDPDAPQGSRSGPNPPPSPPDAGTPARWNHMVGTANAPLGVQDGKSNFYNCGGAETGGCAGPLDHGCHCESQIGSQANWDIAKKLIAIEFGGNIYNAPPGPTEVSGWQYMDRLWYLTRDPAEASYTASGPSPTGTTSGCAVTTWYSTYRFVDDDNGNLADGTPHAGILFAAFDLHAIACGAATDPTNQPTPCAFRPAAPTLSTCSPNRAPVQLSWTASPGADRYRLLRNTLGCGFGFTPAGEIEGWRTYFEDADVAPGVTYYYSIQPLSENASCYGHASNCVAVTPTPCVAPTAPAPTSVMATTPANSQVLVSWSAATGAGSYRISRKDGNCASSNPYVPVAVVASPATSFLDTANVGGQQEYAYVVESSDTTCGACPSAPSACVSVRATGPCVAAPAFAGLSQIGPGGSGCSIQLGWAAAVSPCDSPVRYNVYGATDPGFVPGPANLLVSGLAVTSFTDYAVVTGVRYFYIVRARDAFGNVDPNTVRKDEQAVSLTPGPFSDNAGDSGLTKFSNSLSYPAGTWTVRPSDAPLNATRVYATTASGSYADRSCMALESQTIVLGASPSLSFSTRYDLETGWDGGYVEVATESGGYSNWTKLTTIAYPGVMTSTQTHPACGGASFNDGEPVFTGMLAAYQTFSGSLAAYANQRVRVRFLFGSDDATNATGWFIDDVTVTGGMQSQPCLGEVSGKSSGHPLLLFRRPDGDLKLVFEDLGTAATSYNVYEGTLGGWYSHTGETCHATSSTPGSPVPGERTLEPYATPALRIYLLVSASNASTEGVLGTNSQGQVSPSGSPQSCGPTP